MQLQSLTSPSLISVESEFTSKEDVIRYLTKQLYYAGKLESEEEYLQAVLEREKHSATGFEGGLAIPHGKSKVVKEAAFAVTTLKTPISDWESVDPNNQVQLVFLLAIPESEAGNTHLDLLAELVTRLTNTEYKQNLVNAKDSSELYKYLDQIEEKQSKTRSEERRVGKESKTKRAP